MNEVVVNGVRYIPESEASAPPEVAVRIGIGVTTRNRPDIAAKTIAEIQRLTPGAVIVMVDDASSKPYPQDVFDGVTIVRHEQNLGIAASKNRCLEELYSRGVEHFFLFDDDAYPQAEDWWRPYVESPEPHLMYIFQDLAGNGPRLNDCKVIRDQPDLVAYSSPRGVMLYIDRPALEVAGGMDLGFGKWGYEHGDWSNRIHAFGLTSFRYADVKGSSALIYSMDEHVRDLGGHERSVPPEERKANLAPNKERHDRQYNQAIRYPFHRERDVVLTAYLTGVKDTQRGKAWQPDVKQLEPLLSSLSKHYAAEDVLVFANGIVGVDRATVVPAESVGNPYFDRWLHFYRWLRDHPEVRYVWCVDATDVVLLGAPLPLEPGKLYVGSEPTTVGMEWMRTRGPEYAAWIEEHKHETLLNCGLIGGDRATVMAVLHDLVREYHDFKGAGKDLVVDMPAFNYVVRKYPIVTGPAIHTVFRANDHKSKVSMWAHK